MINNKILINLFKYRYFIGSVWMGIMRSQRGREHAIKFLMKYIPKMKSDEDEEENKNEDSSNLSDEDYSDLEKAIEPIAPPV